MIKLGIKYIIFFIFLWLIIGCNKEDDKIFNAITFPEVVYFNKLSSEAVLSIENSSSKSLMLNLKFNEIVNNNMGIEVLWPIEANSTLDLNLVLNRAFITEELYTSNIDIYIPALDRSVSVPVVAESAIPEHISLDYDIIDAVYYENGDKIVAISTHPDNALLIINPDNGTTQKILLNSKPLSFSVNENLQNVVIGQTNQFSIIDLNSLDIKVTPYDVAPLMVFMPNKKWLYALRNISFDIGIDIDSKEKIFEEHNNSIYLKFHPHKENCLIAAGDNTMIFNLAALDFTKGSLVELYSRKEPVDEKRVFEKFWLTKDKNWIISKNRAVFQCSANINEDLKFNRILDEGSYVNTFTHMNKYNKILTINRYGLQQWHPDQNQIVVYNEIDLNPIGKFPVPGFSSKLYNDMYKSSEGYFLFSNNAQSKVYVLVTLGTRIREGNLWKLLVYDADKIFI